MSDFPLSRLPFALRRACIALALLTLVACASMNEGGSPPPVEVPEPGAHATHPRASGSASTAHARGTQPAPVVRPSSSRYPRATAPAAARSYPVAPAPSRSAPPRGTPVPDEGGTTYESAPQSSMSSGEGALPLPGAAPASDSDGGLTIEQSTSAPSGRQIEAPEFVPVQSHNSAVNTLLAQSDAQRRSGNLDAAIAAAERALRISPDDPTVYYQLSALRLRRGDTALAEQLARKGLSYQPDAELRARLNEIIQNIRMRT